MQKRGALEVPRVLLMDEERSARHDESGGHREPPPPALQLSAHERELDRTGEHQDLGPRAVREHVQRRVGEEDHHRPHQQAEREGEAGPQVGAPGAALPDLGADDRLGEQA